MKQLLTHLIFLSNKINGFIQFANVGITKAELYGYRNKFRATVLDAWRLTKSQNLFLQLWTRGLIYVWFAV